MDTKLKYPLVFVHGMFGWGQNEGIDKVAPYWGATTGSLVDYLADCGVESYAASVGPLSSAWDQACELYAQLTGTRVDYGKAHSKKFNHSRFGRAYEKPLFDGWNNNKKIHLIGHSFGGNAIRMLVSLLTFGSEEEIIETDDDNISPLFKGGNQNLVCSVTAICSPLNGTSAYETAKKMKIVRPLIWGAYTYAGIAGRSRFNGKYVDFHLEQFGLTDTKTQKNHTPLIKKLKEITKTKDSIEFDMSPEGAEKLNSKIKISPDVFYFSYPFNAVRKTQKSNMSLPLDTDFAFLTVTSTWMIKAAAYNEKKTHIQQEFDNDGLVNVASATHPFAEPFKKFDGTAEKGLWNVMPVRKGDHGTAVGLFANKEQTRNFYNDIIGILAKTERDKVFVINRT